jgi:ankyrin repeat protein
LLKRQPTEKRIQYVNAPSVRGAPLYVTSTFGKKEVAFKFMELLINYGADINLASGPQGTPIMAACYYGRYDSVAFLLKKGARTTYRRLDGTQVTALECGKNHPEIQQLLMNFEQRGVEALDEPLLAVKADMTKVQECMAQIKEELTMQSNKSESDHDSESDGDSDSNDQTEDDDDGGTDNDKGKNDNEEDDGSSKSMDENEDKDGETTHTFAE